MTIQEIPVSPSAHGLKQEVLSYEEVLAQFVAVIAPTTLPAAVLSFVSASSGKVKRMERSVEEIHTRFTNTANF